MMQNALFGGINAAVLTPMNADLSPDPDRMTSHCRWLLDNGCNGLSVLGTTGEANSLGINERIAVLEALVARGIPPARLLPGTGTTALTDTVDLTRRAAALGCRGALLLPPFYYKNPSDDGLFAYFDEIIQRTGGAIKLYLYHIPQQSAVGFGVELIGRLLTAYPAVVKGIKDSSGDFANARAYVEHFARHGFEIYAGDDSLLLPLLQAGAAGCITAASNVSCSVGARVYAGCNTAAGERAQATLTATRRVITSVPVIPGLKALLARHTNDAGWHVVRPPHLQLTAAQQAKLFVAFDACGIELPRPA